MVLRYAADVRPAHTMDFIVQKMHLRSLDVKPPYTLVAMDGGILIVMAGCVVIAGMNLLVKTFLKTTEQIKHL
jgi:hypothetical protein